MDKYKLRRTETNKRNCNDKVQTLSKGMYGKTLFTKSKIWQKLNRPKNTTRWRNTETDKVFPLENDSPLHNAITKADKGYTVLYLSSN